MVSAFRFDHEMQPNGFQPTFIPVFLTETLPPNSSFNRYKRYVLVFAIISRPTTFLRVPLFVVPMLPSPSINPARYCHDIFPDLFPMAHTFYVFTELGFFSITACGIEADGHSLFFVRHFLSASRAKRTFFELSHDLMHLLHRVSPLGISQRTLSGETSQRNRARRSTCPISVCSSPRTVGA